MLGFICRFKTTISKNLMEIKTSITPKSRDEFLAAIDEFARGTGLDYHDVLIRQVGNACYDAMVFTPPMASGGGKGTEKVANNLGKFAVYWDISAIFGTPQQDKSNYKFFRNMTGALKQGDKSRFSSLLQEKNATKVRNGIFRKILDDSNTDRAFGKMKNLLNKFVPSATYTPESVVTDLGPIHKRLLRESGNRKLRKNKKFLGYQYVVDSKERIKTYIKAQEQQVGRLKAGWAGAIRNLPAMKGRQQKTFGGRIPAWISRHDTSTGYCSSNLSNREYMQIKVGNAIGDNDGVATDAKPESTLSVVFGNRVKQMPKEMQNFLDKRAKKFNKR